MKIFDTHTHYMDERYDTDRYKILEFIKLNNVSDILLISADMSELEKNISLINDENIKKNKDIYPNIYMGIGMHPDELPRYSPDSNDGVDFFNKLNDYFNEKVLTIGEFGLDYYGDKDSDNKDNQKKWFIEFLNFAKEKKLPINVHSRDAANDTYEIIKEYGKGLTGIIHCYSYDGELAKKFVDLGFLIGVGGVVTFKNGKKLKETVSKISLECIVTETDCPYLSPEPHRGERNNSSYIKYVIEEIANIKNIDIETVGKQVYNNALKVYNC